MAKQLYIGTSGWSYPKGAGSWNGVFYPRVKRGEKLDELKYYAERFNAVEVNSTFYRPTSEPIARSWAQRTPKDFKFCLKLYQKFTHPKMFADALGKDSAQVGDNNYYRLQGKQDADYFKQSIEPIVKADKFGCLLIQFPPSFHNEPKTITYLDSLLEIFKDYQPVVELRHRSWSDGQKATDELFTNNKASEVQIDEPKFYSSIQQDENFIGPVVYYRFHGRNKKDWWAKDAGEQRYNYLYSKPELQPFTDEIKKQAKKKTAYVFFNNHFKAKAVANGLMMRSQLGEKLDKNLFNENLLKVYSNIL